MKKIKEIFANLDSDIFTENVQTMLTDIVLEKVTAAKDSAYTEGVERGLEYTSKKLKEQDDDHSEKLEKLLEHIDTEHVEKLQCVLETIDKDHAEKLGIAIEAITESIDVDYTEKLQNVKDHYENVYETKIVEKVSDFIDTFIEESTPTEAAFDGARLDKLESTFNTIKEMLMVDEISTQSHIKEAILDGKSQITESQERINDLIIEKIKLKKEIKKYEVDNLLESKTSDMSPAKSRFVKRFVKDVDDIETMKETIDEAVKAYSVDSTQDRDTILETKSPREIEVPKDISQIKENVEKTDEVINDEPSDLDTYIDKLNKSFKR